MWRALEREITVGQSASPDRAAGNDGREPDALIKRGAPILNDATTARQPSLVVIVGALLVLLDILGGLIATSRASKKLRNRQRHVSLRR